IGIQILAGQSAAAKPECEEARVLLEAELAKRQPEDRVWVSELAWIYVCLGRNADALRLAREAAETMPIEKDAILGINFLVGLAQIEAHTGQSEEAVKILRQLLTIPAGEYVSVARLKIDPVWDPIRNDRSEEHTSELQSPCNLVCRLLLEKKKKITLPTVSITVR